MSWHNEDSQEERWLRVEAWIIGVFVVGGYVWLGVYAWRAVVG